MTKKDIVRAIAAKTETPQLRIKNIVQLTFETICELLAQDERLEIRNFGVFEVRTRQARKARNPRTGEIVDSPEKRVVSFKPGKMMEDKVQK